MLQTMQARSERCCPGGTKFDIVAVDVLISGGEEWATEDVYEMSVCLLRVDDDDDDGE
jgi:hypothetical protein